MKKILLEITPLSCAGCAKHIENRILEQNGVVSTKVLGQLGKVAITYDDSTINVKQLESILVELGYPTNPKTTA